jgi:hypothetical protein
VGYGYSVETIEAFARSAFPQRVHSQIEWLLVAWDRGGESGSPSKRERSWFKPLDCQRWWYIIDSHRKTPPKVDVVDALTWTTKKQDDTPYEEAGLYSGFGERSNGFISPPRTWMAFIDFAPKPELFSSRAADAFWRDVERFAPKKRVYVFDSGNSYHGFLTATLDYRGLSEWHSLLGRHPKVVDQGWLDKSRATLWGGVLRVTAGRPGPVPRLKQWVNL